jgi:serine/threonine-protein kinase
VVLCLKSRPTSLHQSIGDYKILSKLGEGGIGEVWRATATELNRESPSRFCRMPLRRTPFVGARFAREAQGLAFLNHPNIAAIYGLKARALVMKLVDGRTLTERIALGPIPLDEALSIARQLAEALEYAHERGVIHRDLSYAKVPQCPDFGLYRRHLERDADSRKIPCAPADAPAQPPGFHAGLRTI